MTNSWDATLAGLNPTSWWKFDEASGDWLDSGSDGTLDFPERLSSGNPENWRQAPGNIRGTPRVYGNWQGVANHNSFLQRFASGIAESGWVSGTMGAVVHVPTLSQQINVLNQIYDNSNANRVGIVIQTDGLVRYEAQSGANVVRGRSAVGAIQEGGTYLIVGVQRVDGTGPRVYINGVDVTNDIVLAGSGTNDSWMDGVIVGAGVETALNLNHAAPNATGGTEGTAVITGPFVGRNVDFSPTDIANLFSSINGFDQSPSDWYEWAFENAGASMRYWLPGWSAPTAGQPVSSRNNDGWNPGAAEDFQDGQFNSPNPSTRNAVSTNIVTDFTNWKWIWADDISIGDAPVTWMFDSTDTVGTWTFLFEIKSTAIASTSFLFWFGRLAVSSLGLRVSIEGSTFGGALKIEYDDGTDQWQWTSVNSRFQVDDVVVATFVQDGSELRIYIDGVDETSDGIFSGTGDRGLWAAGIDAIGGGQGGQFGSQPASGADNWNPNELDFGFFTQEVFNAALVAAQQDAINGIFPGEDEPPEDGFFETLDETGNDSDPNGPGPDHWWRMNEIGPPLKDIGISVISGNTRATGGDPDFDTQGPLILDPTNAAVYCDGQGDYFEVGVDGAAGELVTGTFGTLGFFFSLNTFGNNGIVYSESDDLATQFISFAINDDVAELVVQTSAGNLVTFTSSVATIDLDYLFIVFTCDTLGNYLVYVNGVVDPDAVVAVQGTGVEGLWFGDVTATRSAISARADSSFTTETDGRSSELFIYIDEVLTAAQIAALFDAAIRDGILGVAAPIAAIVFEDCTFINGGTDIRAELVATDFNQLVQVDRCRFIGGAEGQTSIIMEGANTAIVRGSVFDLGVTPTTGRSAILGRSADPTAVAASSGSLLVADSTFNRMGQAAQPAVFANDNFSLTVERNRFLNTEGGATGWNADCDSINVWRNLVDTLTNGIGGIVVGSAGNGGVGNGWRIGDNMILNVAGGRGIVINGENAVATFARHVLILRNQINGAASSGIAITGLQDATLSGNVIEGGVDGIEIDEVAGVIGINRNRITGHSGKAVIMAPSTVQVATVVIQENSVEGALNGGGISVTNLTELVIAANRLLNLANGLTLGEITSSAKIGHNTWQSVASPLTLLGSTTQVGLEVARQQISDLGDLETLTVVTEAVEVSALQHLLTAAAPTNLTDIGTLDQDGFVIVLRLALGASNITLVDASPLNLAGANFVMDTPGESQMMLVQQGGEWYEIGRQFGS